METEPTSTPPEATPSRRVLLGAALAAGAGAGAGLITGRAVATSGNGQPPAAAGPAAASPPESFYGAHQPGITSHPLAALRLTALDVRTARRDEVRRLLVSWSRLAGDFAARAAANPADQITATIGLGRSLLTNPALGLAPRLPDALVDLPAFPRDQIDQARSGGDLCLHVCAAHPGTAFAATRELLAVAGSAAAPRWSVRGFLTVNGAETPRNLLGFKDSSGNPPAGEARDAVVWTAPESEPQWMAGGTYLVMRRIRADLDRWDRLDRAQQERIVGRDRHTGAPLSTGAENTPADFAATGPDGQPLIPIDSHLRRANLVFTRGARIHRRGYNYDDGLTPDGRTDAGAIFLSYQADPRRGFIPIHTNLANADALHRFLTHTASAVFAIPPGCAPDSHIGALLWT